MRTVERDSGRRVMNIAEGQPVKEISIAIIPHSGQRYETVGDYWYPRIGRLTVRVSDMENEDYHFLVMIHELVEAHLCKKRGICEDDITAFDKAASAQGPEAASEPGNSPEAPYHKEHMFATAIERELAIELEVDWERYDATVNALSQETELPRAESSEEKKEFK